MPKFLIIDANSMINRSFYAIKPLTNSEGVHTNGIYGFLNTLLNELETERPDYIACAFDVSRKTFRARLFPEYKGTRKETPDELKEQFPILKNLLKAMNIPVIEKEDYEADDIIGTISKSCSENKYECLILTGDKDDLQLIDDYVNVKLIITQMGKTTTTKTDAVMVYEKYGITPKELIELKALMGDKSDNIPGVAGIGEVTGLGLIKEYKSLEKLYENIDSIKESVRKKLLSDKDNAFLSRELGTIVRDVPIDLDFENYAAREYNEYELSEMLKYLGFNSIISRLNLTNASAPAEPVAEFEISYAEISKNDIKKLFFIIDNEKNEEKIFICHENVVYSYSLSEKKEYVSSLLSDENITKITFNVKQLLHAGYIIGGDYFDAALMAYIVNPQNGDSAPSKLFNIFFNVNIAAAAAGAFYLPKLFDILSSEIEKSEQEYISDMEHHLIKVLYDMEKEGVKVNNGDLMALSERFDSKTLKLTDEIFASAGKRFNINSPKQLGDVLFNDLGLISRKKTKTGYSTSAEVLDELSGAHPIIDLIKEYRQITKLNSTYVEGFKAARDENNIIRTTYNQALTQTGRLSSTEPNLQNIPVRTEIGREIRAVIIPKNDLFISADYSQIELRILAHISNDENLINAFLNDEDIHDMSAKKLFNSESVTPEMRRVAKAVNFGLIYGKGEFSLAKDLGITRREAGDFINKYLGQYPNVENYMKSVVETARQNGFTTTLYNRRRYFPDINAKNHVIRSAAERAVLNSPIQGTAADIIKLAMLTVFDRLNTSGLKSKLVLQIHDELIIDCRYDEKETVTELLKNSMENAVKLSVPLTVSISEDKNL